MLTYHIFVAEWGPQTGVSKSLLLNGGLCAFTSVGDCDGAGHSSVKHVYRGGDLDVVAVEKESINNIISYDAVNIGYTII